MLINLITVRKSRLQIDISKGNATVPEKDFSAVSSDSPCLSSQLALALGAGAEMPTRREYLLFLTASILFILIVLVILVYIYLEPVRYRLHQTILEPERLRSISDVWGFWTPFIFILLQAVEVLLMVWPVPLEIAGGLLFGVPLGTLYSTLGLALGTMTTFYLGRWINKRWLNQLLGQDTRELIQRLIKREGALAAFFIYLLPGIPKDFFGYFFGLSRISPLFFLIITMLARLPATILMTYQGTQASGGHVGIPLGVIFFYFLMGYIIYKNRQSIYVWLQRWCPEEDDLHSRSKGKFH